MVNCKYSFILSILGDHKSSHSFQKNNTIMVTAAAFDLIAYRRNE